MEFYRKILKEIHTHSEMSHVVYVPVILIRITMYNYIQNILYIEQCVIIVFKIQKHKNKSQSDIMNATESICSEVVKSCGRIIIIES